MHPELNNCRFVPASDLEHMKNDFRESWAIDCGGFTIRLGFNELAHGDSDPIIIVENHAGDGLNLVHAASLGRD
jgi:hypothetical protein